MARSLPGSGRTEIREYLNETRVSKLTLADPYRSIFSSFLHTGCNCIRRHKSLLVAPGITGVPSESWTEGERERESKCLSGKEGEGGGKREGAIWVERSCYTQSVSSLCDVLASFSRLV